MRVRKAFMTFPFLPIILPTSSSATLSDKMFPDWEISSCSGEPKSGVMRNLRKSSISV